ncbi:MAG: cryptochrome/photolyase family protein [Parachlamydiaceae bacterium]
MKAVLILPHQLWETHPYLEEKGGLVILAEDALFFGDLRYPNHIHKQKLVFHRASMKCYEDHLKKRGFRTLYLEFHLLREGRQAYERVFRQHRVTTLSLVDPVDYLVEKRLMEAARKLDIHISIKDSPAFLMTREDVDSYFSNLDHFSFMPFYINQRRDLEILLEGNGKPMGGKWTFDSENRRKAPKNYLFPPLKQPLKNQFLAKAIEDINRLFSENVGNLDSFIYETTSKGAKEQLKSFLDNRLENFGIYQDAILQDELCLMHAMLSPYLNSGLLTPLEVITSTLEVASYQKIPINSLEGFLRQVIGWREFMRGVYQTAHIKIRRGNFWQHTRTIPDSFYLGTTGILPIDRTIHKVNRYAYCHHIERLMVLGSFMLLCEFAPDEVYRWFMSRFIDAYDWVMVPNVYSMSQYADGGMTTTKPYLCSSNYIRKMSDYPKGDWCAIWDALFWRFLHKHEAIFLKQPRLSLLAQQIKRMDSKTLNSHLELGESFLQNL